MRTDHPIHQWEREVRALLEVRGVDPVTSDAIMASNLTRGKRDAYITPSEAVEDLWRMPRLELGHGIHIEDTIDMVKDVVQDALFRGEWSTVRAYTVMFDQADFSSDAMYILAKLARTHYEAWTSQLHDLVAGWIKG